MTPIDDRMFDVLEEVWRERKARERGSKKAAREPEVDSKLAPREVQRLLRAGHTPAEVAQMAGVAVGWVEKYFSPVMHERNGVINDAQTLWLEKPKLGSSGLPLGESVLANLRSRHVRMDDDTFAEAWGATRQDGQPWVISLEFSFRGRRQRAVWRYDPHRRTVTAANRLAADLGYVKNGKKAAAHVAQVQRPAAKKRPAARKRTPAKKRPPAKRRSAAKRAPAKRRTTAKRTPVRRAPAKRRPAAKRPAAKRTAAKRRPAAKRAKTTRRAPARRPAKKTTRRAPARKTSTRRTSARRPASRRPARRTRRRR